jgi:type I restriction enzyme S subunit
MHSGRFKREARITTNLAHLSQSRCASIEFPIPSTAEQIEIVQFAQMLEEQAFEQFEHIEMPAIGALRQSILKAAFEGRLMEQDPSDDPADRMLTRLSEDAATIRPRGAKRSRRATLAAE